MTQVLYKNNNLLIMIYVIVYSSKPTKDWHTMVSGLPHRSFRLSRVFVCRQTITWGIAVLQIAVTGTNFARVPLE